MIKEFLAMFEGKINFFEGELIKTEKVKVQIQFNIRELEEKKKILSDYLQLIKGNGFGYMKQQVDDHFEKMKEADSNRISEQQFCGLPYKFMRKQYNCLKPFNHDGKCGVV